MKRNRESKYRQKIISKYYMNKSEQKQLDEIVNHPSKQFMKTTYKELYLKPRSDTFLFLVSNVNQCRVLMSKIGIDIREGKSYKSVYNVMSELSGKFHIA
jgi:hypothetical protein